MRPSPSRSAEEAVEAGQMQSRSSAAQAHESNQESSMQEYLIRLGVGFMFFVPPILVGIGLVKVTELVVSYIGTLG